MGFLLLNLLTSQPEIGSPISELMGIAKRRFPNSASFRPKLVLIDGILDAQEAKQKPTKKKYTLSAMRCLDC